MYGKSTIYYFHNTPPWTNHNNILTRRAPNALLKTLSLKSPVGQKSIERENECNALNVHISPFDMNNLNLATC